MIDYPLIKYIFWPLLSYHFLFFIPLGATTQIGIISDSIYCGEREVGQRIKIAAKNLGWQVFLDENKGIDLQKIKDLDFCISLLPTNQYPHPNCPNYQTIFHPFHFLNNAGEILPFYEKYDGFLLTIKKTNPLERSFKLKNKEIPSIIFYPTVQFIEYKQNPLNSLMTTTPVWGNRIRDSKYLKLYSLLDSSGFTKFYGSKRNKRFTPLAYEGNLPFDGYSMIKALQQHGIVLIIHSDVHNEHSIPSARIFEAAAASTVIICDENPFVKDHFADSVFYIDTSLSSSEIYAKICEHMQEIRSNPSKALEMAKKAHQIYLDHFLMEDQLLKLQEMHQNIKK